MSTPVAPTNGGFFAQLMPMLAERTVMMVVSRADDQHLAVSLIPKQLKESENTALSTPLCCTGTPEELDRELPTQVRDYVAGHVALSNNLAEIQREREQAEKAAREEARKKTKSVGKSGKTVDDPANAPPPKKETPAPQATLNLFEQAEASTAASSQATAAAAPATDGD